MISCSTDKTVTLLSCAPKVQKTIFFWGFIGSQLSLPNRTYQTTSTSDFFFFIAFYETLDSRFSTSRELKSNRSSCCLFNSWEKICKLTFQCFHSPSSWASPLICVLSCLCLGVPHECVSVFASHSYSVYTLLSTGCRHGVMFTINIGSLCAQSVTSGIQP